MIRLILHPPPPRRDSISVAVLRRAQRVVGNRRAVRGAVRRPCAAMKAAAACSCNIHQKNVGADARSSFPCRRLGDAIVRIALAEKGERRRDLTGSSLCAVPFRAEHDGTRSASGKTARSCST